MSGPLRIAVASGKGGTGKTTVATNLAVTLAKAGTRTTYVDCDVEEPNGHLFLKPEMQWTREVCTLVPEVDEQHCTLCGACGNACRYSAIVSLPKKVLTFPNLCHSCGGCTLACAEGAIREVLRATGTIEKGHAGRVAFLHGTLSVGEAMAPPVIREVLSAAPADGTVIIDAPPGTSCPVIESIKTADAVVLVTEPTPFGLNDLKLAVQMVRELGVRFGVVVNRVGTGDNAVLDFCATEQIPVLMQIPESRAIAVAYSRGVLAVTTQPALGPMFLALHEQLRALPLADRPRPAEPDIRAPVLQERLDRLPSEALPAGQRGELDELVVISGKGGTGKTSIVASLVSLAEQAAVADCDVDAADLHLVLRPSVQQRWPFSGGNTAVIDAERCTACGVCTDHCRFDAIASTPTEAAVLHEVDPISCEGCGVCTDLCPEGAASLVPAINGEWFVSETTRGPMVHARLGVAQQNSGKLVSLVRREAKAVAHAKQRRLLICDGSPGIGCPVIASIAGARTVLVVTEPTLSGQHDLHRVAKLCRQFDVEAAVCINKADINPEIATQIEVEAARLGLCVLGRVRYDAAVTSAQICQSAVVDHSDSPAAQDIRTLWKRVRDVMR